MRKQKKLGELYIKERPHNVPKNKIVITISEIMLARYGEDILLQVCELYFGVSYFESYDYWQHREFPNMCIGNSGKMTATSKKEENYRASEYIFIPFENIIDKNPLEFEQFREQQQQLGLTTFDTKMKEML